VKWGENDQLGPGQSPMPIVWQQAWPDELDDVTDDDMVQIQGEGKASRVYTYGHQGSRANGRHPHYISTRTGYPLHVDVGFVRFTHQVVLRNDGFMVCGLAGTTKHPQPKGTVYCLDTHSPHQVIRDTRLPQVGLYKLQAAVDADRPLTLAEVQEALAKLLAEPHGWVERALQKQ
jgi:hypothetical protein